MTATDAAPAAERPRPPPFDRWVALVLLSVAMFGNYYVYDTIAPVADLLTSQLGFNDEQIGLLYSTYSWAAVIVLLAGGVVIDRFGTARSILVFGAICTVAGIMTAVSPDFRVMAAGRFLLGIGAEPLIVAVTTAIAKWFKGKELSFAFGLNLTIARLGSVAADNSPTWAHRFYTGWQPPLQVGAVLGATCIVSGVLYWMLEGRVSRRAPHPLEGAAASRCRSSSSATSSTSGSPTGTWSRSAWPSTRRSSRSAPSPSSSSWTRAG
jgi:MFS family permease